MKYLEALEVSYLNIIKLSHALKTDWNRAWTETFPSLVKLQFTYVKDLFITRTETLLYNDWGLSSMQALKLVSII